MKLWTSTLFVALLVATFAWVLGADPFQQVALFCATLAAGLTLAAARVGGR